MHLCQQHENRVSFAASRMKAFHAIFWSFSATRSRSAATRKASPVKRVPARRRRTVKKRTSAAALAQRVSQVESDRSSASESEGYSNFTMFMVFMINLI